MNPVAIFRHAAHEGPGFLATCLEQRGIPWQLICIDQNDPLPAHAGAYSGLVFMGGPMSVNDELPWIPPVLALIREAHARDIPLLGHCLGGQLMSKALGGVVTRNPVKEIGWGGVSAPDNDTAQAWLGDCRQFEAFHWHGETFSLPPDAQLLLSNEHCQNQAFVLGPHLGMQCHVEMEAAMIEDWCTIGADEIAAASRSPAVQSIIEIRAQSAEKLPALQRVAAQLYRHWMDGVASRNG